MRPRIAEELAFLRESHADIQHATGDSADWFLLPLFPFPEGWRRGDEPVAHDRLCFPINAVYPSGEPYSFAIPSDLTFRGQAPNNSQPITNSPFPGAWQQLSWSPDSPWQPSADVRKGSNLVAWVRSFRARLKEGV